MIAIGGEKAMNWAEVMADPCLQDLPYKIELNGHGEIVMTPASARHSIRQGRLAYLLAVWLGENFVLTECPIQTTDGVRVPDAAWASPGFMERHGDETPLPVAPELCVEILSPSNSAQQLGRKVALYLAAGAQEVWIVPEIGQITIHGPEGERAASCFPGVPQPITL